MRKLSVQKFCFKVSKKFAMSYNYVPGLVHIIHVSPQKKMQIRVKNRDINFIKYLPFILHVFFFEISCGGGEIPRIFVGKNNFQSNNRALS